MNNKNEIPLLSKSRFMAGLQCHKYLYLECFNRNLADPADEVQQAIFDTGTEVGELARCLFPDGLLIIEDHLHHIEAMESTSKVISNASVPAVFEAAFLHDDIRIRADILVRIKNDLFDLVEIKSTTQVKDEHIPDVSVQLYVLKRIGIKVRRSCIGHLNREYIYPGGYYDLNQLFCIEDVTDQALAYLPGIPALLAEMRNSLQNPEPPDIKVGKHCSKPFQCPYFGHCHDNLPEHHILQLPWAREKLLSCLEEAGIDDIKNIPADFPGLNAIQKRVCECVANNCLHLDKRELSDKLQGLEYPIHFLDFETFNPALPLYAGTRPYQIIPFQWSNYKLYENDQLTHESFLYEGSDDPRESFANSLIDTLGSEGSIVVYSSFEASRIREMASTFPNLAEVLLSFIDSRMVDLHKIIKSHCYHPLFHGSFSIKTVLPALVPDINYNDMAINDGMMASISYAEMRRSETSSKRHDILKKNLLAYCKRDSEAEVQLYRALINHALA